MIFRKSFVFVTTFLFVVTLHAQNLQAEKAKDSTSIGKLAAYDTKQAFLGVKYAFSSPFHWKGKDFRNLGVIALGAVALNTIDDESSRFFVRQEPGVPQVFQEFGTRFGSPQVYFIANVSLYGFGVFTKNEKIRKTSVLIISSSFTSGLIQSVSKTAFGRARPLNGYKSTSFRFWTNEPKFHSFPSGHTVLSVTMAHAIAKQFKNPWSKVVVYSLGAIAPTSRLFKGAHWLTDVSLGAVLSIVVVDRIDKFLCNTNAYNSHTKKKKQISWRMHFSANKIGLIGYF